MLRFAALAEKPLEQGEEYDEQEHDFAIPTLHGRSLHS